MRAMAFVVVSMALAACHAESKSPPPVVHHDPPDDTSNTYRVVGLDKLARKPIAVVIDANAWSGSPENLPAVTVYEDGAVITCHARENEAEIVEGTIRDPAALAKTIADDLAGLAPRVTISKATDQPEVTIYARRGDVWRSVKVVGFHGRMTEPAPKNFVEAYDTLTKLSLEGAHPFARTDFEVTLNDDSVPSHEAAEWPADVPPPPASLRPDERWLGRPRSYDLRGAPGESLKALARKRQGYGVRTPSGERVALVVVVAIPSNEWIHKLERCTPWELQPFHECDADVPGRVRQ